MRMLDCKEQVIVAGGFGSFSCPPCPEDCPITGEVTIPGKRNPSNSDPRFGATNLTIISGSINIMLFRDAWSAAVDAEELLRTESGRPAAIDEDEAIDNTPGYPVEHQKGLGISDYQEAWQKVLSKMSAAELTAFSGALAKVAADAKAMKEKGASDRLAQLAAAVLVGDSIGAAFASNQASDNLRGKSMALFEGLITKAYAAAAALPGGI